MMTDPIADLLTRIRNANVIRQKTVNIPYSKVKENIIKILLEEGFIKNYRVIETDKVSRKSLRIYLKYDKYGNKAINEIKRVSRSGRRVYKGYKEVRKVLDTLGIAVVSTSKGIMSDKVARKLKLGGEVFCEVW